MPRRKTKTRSVFITKEPEWKTLKLLTDVSEREKAFKECEYFVRTEIKSKQTVAAAKNWIKNNIFNHINLYEELFCSSFN